MFDSSLKDSFEALEAIVTAAAILAGGGWSYWRFVHNRQKYPRARIAQKVTARPFSTESWLVHVAVEISNVGEVLLELESGYCFLQQIEPVPQEVLEKIELGVDPVADGATEFAWPCIGHREFRGPMHKAEIEPGECEQLRADFLVGRETKTIRIYSYLRNRTKRKRELGWSCTTTANLELLAKAGGSNEKGSESTGGTSGTKWGKEATTAQEGTSAQEA